MGGKALPQTLQLPPKFLPINVLANNVSTTHTYTPQIWDRSTLQLWTVLEGHTGAVFCLQYNEKVVISGSWDQTVKLVNTLPLST